MSFTYHLIVTNHALLLPLIDSLTDAMIDHIGCSRILTFPHFSNLIKDHIVSHFGNLRDFQKLAVDKIKRPKMFDISVQVLLLQHRDRWLIQTQGLLFKLPSGTLLSFFIEIVNHLCWNAVGSVTTINKSAYLQGTIFLFSGYFVALCKCLFDLLFSK